MQSSRWTLGFKPMALAAACWGIASASVARATVYTDSTADQAGGGTQVVDISAVEVTNDATNISFKITLVGDISVAGTSDFGKYHIGFDTVAGGSTTPAVGWGQQFGLSSGMDYWVGSWVNFGGGAVPHLWDGAAWATTPQSATVTLDQFSTTITVPLAALGLAAGSTFSFDVWSTFDSPGGQSAYDASSNPNLAIAEPWNGTPYDSSTAGAGGTPLVSTYVVAGAAVTGTWNVDANGDWSQSGNWSGGAPNGADHVANFAGIITAARTVTVDAPQTVGTITFDNASSYTLAGANALTLDVSAGSAAIQVVSGSHQISAPIILSDDAVLSVTPAASTLTLAGNLTAAGRAISKTGAGTAQVLNLRAAALDVSAGTLKVSAKPAANAPEGTSVVSALSIASGAAVDLTNNSMVIDYTTVGTLVDDTRQHLAAGRLTTSAAAPAGTKLGYADNAVLGLVSFAGQTVDATSLLVKFTYAGDTNLDGQVDITDLGNLATNWQTAGVWTAGDSDYSGFIDITDLGALATNWQAGVGSPLSPSFNDALAAVGLGGVTVPEPSLLAIAASLGIGLVRRPRA